MLETWLRKRRQANSCIQPPPTPTKGSISASVTTKKKKHQKKTPPLPQERGQSILRKVLAKEDSRR